MVPGLSGIAGRSRRRIGGGCLAAAALLVLSGCGSSSHPSASPSGGVYRQHTDGAHGFIIDYPDAWNVYKPTDPAIDFLVGPTETDFAVVRVISDFPTTFDPSDTQTMKQLVDISLAGLPINIISLQQVSVGGLPGWQATYTFQDPKYGIGAKVHVFLFQGNRIHTIVFQALPRAHFDGLAPTFQKILNSYRALPLPSPSPGAATPTPS